MKQDVKRIPEIQERLKARYPNVKTQLKHKNPFQLLVATILSAQCTDRQVNRATGRLFEHLKTPADFAGADLEDLENRIRSTGFYRNKARHIKACARQIMDRFGGRVPATRDELVTLPGVGRKTANVVLGAAFGVPAMVVDTHVARVSRRLELSRSKNPEKIEADLMQIVPETEWNDFSLRLIFFGREFCTARKPNCPECFLSDLCRSEEKRVAQTENKGRKKDRRAVSGERKQK